MKALATAALAACASAAARQRFAAVDMSPVGGALVPRFFVDAPKLAIRDGGICNPNYHSCKRPQAHCSRTTAMLARLPVTFANDRSGVDIGFPGECCANTNYCYVKPDNKPWCCPVGSNCDSNCAATAYQCSTTVTRTVSETITGGAVVTTSVSSACCGRICPSTSAFRCETQFGGGCCSYGQTCVSSGGCHACDDGQGCCDNLMHCTVVSGTAACAPGNPTITGVKIVDGGSGGLSTGAKAGIGVGVSVVGFALVGVSAWFCLIRRRRRGTTMSQRSGGASRVSGGVSGLVVGGGGGSERPGRSARAMSEVTSGSRPTARGGLTQDYFGPAAVAGPYTETETVVSDGAATTPGRGRGVPLQAHSPSDVVAPVEIDSVGVKRGYGHDVTAVPAEREAEATQERYELYGSEMVSPSPVMPSPQTQSPPLMTPRSITSVSLMDRSPGPPSER
ncbi:uncharacterized protein ColSpa_12777 [Colletotrichum spaethianum]|uniref:Uncharacterized protein n=1 Tax=Colletotrichum spaethianum TaxID=700344 RepID=A0AA37PHT7_9PEZI|nr:uncharacterized protein ColSpa_12777 [Colletotrichum spaethianum]GKT52596.1 hypothetical protein ColSpa_12777 [Colletotrichum spaethianum]